MKDSHLPDNLKPYAGRGRVLRVKEGFNPNSSSLGSIVFVIPAALVAAPVLLAGVASLIESRFKPQPKAEENAPQADPKESRE